VRLPDRPTRRAQGPRHACSASARYAGGTPANAQAAQETGVTPKLLVTDKLGSYGSAFRQLRLTCPHHRGSEKIIAPKTPIKSRDEMSFMDATVQVVSICAAVFQITGAHWSGPRFFGLTDNPKPFVWTKSPDAILAAVQRGREALEAIH
jgi:hypothetical protein